MTDIWPERWRHCGSDSALGEPMRCLSTIFVCFAVIAFPINAKAVGVNSSPVVEGLSHVPVAVRDLASAEKDFQRLGFTLKPGRIHSDGIQNAHVKFEDGTEIELITACKGIDSLTKSYLDHLKNGEGPAFVALYAPNMSVLESRLKASSLPYEAEDGLISFPAGSTTSEIFFAGLNHSPTDKPAYFEHANGADGVIAVWLAGTDLAEETALLSKLGAKERQEPFVLTPNENARAMHMELGEILLLPPKFVVVQEHPVVGVTVRTHDLSKVLTVFRETGMKAPKIVNFKGGRSLLVPPEMAHGMWIEFRESTLR
ncbi:VOC family protein [Dyella sp. 20L07]|uniref:VOC family protein n=1 Tax=Dyella sp. 20L07 TaxID=3384240 RepID=UPI003D2B4939